jgi:DHA1 family bicyclomycin/chloramphenicol resistance-like MFS transporter
VSAASASRQSLRRLAFLLGGLAMFGPFSIDTIFPAFPQIGAQLGANPVQMQQTISVYLIAYALTSVVHGPLSDAIGRRRVILGGLAIFILASIGCALSKTLGTLLVFRAIQGLSAGVGLIVGRTVIRDLLHGDDAQRLMSQVSMIFGVAPAIAPIIGGWLFVHLGWHSIFWFLTAIGIALFIANYKLLPETLHVSQRQPFNVRNLMRGYWQLGSSPRFLLLALASGIPFNGMFLYVLSAPSFLGEHLGLAPTEFFWFFLLSIIGIMAGSFASGRLAGRIPPKLQIRWGFIVMLAVSVLNTAANLMFPAHASWALIPIALFAFGWALMVPVVTLLVLDLYPERRGMASSLQAFIGSAANGIVAGVIAPLVMHSTRALAVASLLMMCVGLVAWLFVKNLWPETGRHAIS